MGDGDALGADEGARRDKDGAISGHTSIIYLTLIINLIITLPKLLEIESLSLCFRSLVVLLVNKDS